MRCAGGKVHVLQHIITSNTALVYSSACLVPILILDNLAIYYYIISLFHPEELFLFGFVVWFSTVVRMWSGTRLESKNLTVHVSKWETKRLTDRHMHTENLLMGRIFSAGPSLLEKVRAFIIFS